jgi:hypothetical protein
LKVTTVGELRKQLDGLPDDMAVRAAVGTTIDDLILDAAQTSLGPASLYVQNGPEEFVVSVDAEVLDDDEDDDEMFANCGDEEDEDDDEEDGEDS